MSDYLDNLVARSLGLAEAEVVRPRLQSLFEPRALTGRFAAVELSSDQDEAPDEPFSRVEPVRSPPAIHAPEIEAVEAVEPPPPLSRHEPPSSPQLQPPDGATVKAMDQPQPPTPTPVDIITGEAGPREDRRAESDQTVAREQTSFHVVSRKTVTVDRRSTLAQQAMPLTPAIPAHEQVMPQIESTAQALLANTLLIAPMIAPRPTDVPERETPHSDFAAPALTEPDTSREQSPTIKITIGRVEVRAVMPPAPAPRPSPERRGLALSLDEYLKRRSGGKS
jgi:hypothetical protein